MMAAELLHGAAGPPASALDLSALGRLLAHRLDPCEEGSALEDPVCAGVQSA
jgi:hypothetical protein